MAIPNRHKSKTGQVISTALQFFHALLSGKSHAGMTKEDLNDMVDVAFDASHAFHDSTGTQSGLQSETQNAHTKPEPGKNKANA